MGSPVDWAAASLYSDRVNHMKLFSAFATAVAFAAFCSSSPAASSFSTSLTGFSGDSTQAATQSAVGAAGLNFYSLSGLNEDFTADPTVQFDATGAKFGSLFGGDGGRNYMRTSQADYATVSFAAEVTFTTTDLDQQDTFFGLGAGDTALFGWPDWSTQFSSVIFTPEINVNPLLTTMFTHNDTPVFANTPAPGLTSGVNRMRMDFDATTKLVTFSVDFGYVGGGFVADATTPAVDVSTLFAQPVVYDAADYTIWRDTLGSTTDLRANWDNTGASQGVIDQADYDFWAANYNVVKSQGWPGEPSRIYFGGDDGVVFSDFVVTVAGGGVVSIPEPHTVAMIAAVGVLSAACRRRR